MARSVIWFVVLLVSIQSLVANPLAKGNIKGMDENTRAAFKSFYHTSLKENGIVGSSFFLVHNNEVASGHRHDLSLGVNNENVYRHCNHAIERQGFVEAGRPDR